MKHIKTYERVIERDETTPEYYLQLYTDKQKETFIYWYDIIKPCLDDYNIICAKKKLVKWTTSGITRHDMYSLLMKHEEIIDEMIKHDIGFQEAKDLIANVKNYNL